MSGLFYREPTVLALRGAIEVFVRLENLFDPRTCRANAEQFSRKRFQEAYGSFVQECWGEFFGRTNQSGVVAMTSESGSG